MHSSPLNVLLNVLYELMHLLLGPSKDFGEKAQTGGLNCSIQVLPRED